MPIHPTAIIDPAAVIDPSAEIGPYVVIEGPVRVGPRTRLIAHVYLTGHTEMGADCHVHPHTVIGNLPQDRAFGGERSYCRIGDRNIIREGVSIHRATGAEKVTVVGNDCFFMANSHVGHNCQVGSYVTLVNGALLGGHVVVGDRAIISGNAGAHQFVRIGELVMVSGNCVPTMDVPPYMIAFGRNECIGINVVGLRRAEFSKDDIAEIRSAYRTLYRGGLGFREAVDQLERTVKTVPGRRLVEFLRAPSKRGICGPPTRRRVNMTDV